MINQYGEFLRDPKSNVCGTLVAELINNCNEVTGSTLETVDGIQVDCQPYYKLENASKSEFEKQFGIARQRMPKLS
jgi:hypothetical protein